MRTEQEIMNDIKAVESMKNFHIEVDEEEETKLMVEAAEWIIANRKGHDSEIRTAEYIIKKYGEQSVII